MTNVFLEDFPSTLFIKVKWKRVVSRIVVAISIQECASGRGHCVINRRMPPLTLSARQWAPGRRCGRSGMLETPCVDSDAAVFYVLAMRYSSFNNWGPHSVFKDKERKLPTKQLLSTHSLRKFSQMFVEKHCLQHKSRKLLNYSLKVFEAHSTLEWDVQISLFSMMLWSAPQSPVPQTVKGMNSHRQGTKTRPVSQAHPIQYPGRVDFATFSHYWLLKHGFMEIWNPM